MTMKSDVKVSRCSGCKIGFPKAVGGEESGTVKLRCCHCGVSSTDKPTVAEAVMAWEKLNQN